ncbi:MAG: endolytic transglycosylase MltG [Thermoactinomyces sp.]
MKWFWRIFFTLVLIAGWGFLGYQFVFFTLGSPKRTAPVEVELPKNTTLKEIGAILQKKHLIRRSYFFRYYAAYKHKTNLQAGVYEIEPDETLDDMLAKFELGEQNTVKVTIPEGWNVLQIADALEKKGFDKKKFLYYLNNKKPKYEFEKEIPNNPARKYKLEGYLYPATYNFYKDETPEEIINEMLGEFAKHMEELQARDILKSNPPMKGMTIDQWVTVASMVEKEGKVKTELPTIAGVIYNRLNNNDPKDDHLGIDATFLYIQMLTGKKIPMYKLRKIPNPYNTYLNKGLPPGPIGCPGVRSLQAALNPQKHNYTYYVARGDGTGLHYFETNAAQHDRDIARSNANERKLKARSATAK